METREMNDKIAALIIHGFTIAHVITAGILGPAAGAVLTPMTAAMVIAIGTQCRVSFNLAGALKIMSNFVGLILGVSIAEVIIGLVPGAGNLANAIATGVVTELLGWGTYVVLRENLDKQDNVGMVQLLRKAAKERKKHKEFMSELKKAREKMTPEERARYDEYMKIITNRDSGLDERQKAMADAQALMEKYGIEF